MKDERQKIIFLKIWANLKLDEPTEVHDNTHPNQSSENWKQEKKNSSQRINIFIEYQFERTNFLSKMMEAGIGTTFFKY